MKISQYIVQLGVNNNYYVKNKVELKNFTYLIKIMCIFIMQFLLFLALFLKTLFPLAEEELEEDYQTVAPQYQSSFTQILSDNNKQLVSNNA